MKVQFNKTSSDNLIYAIRGNKQPTLLSAFNLVVGNIFLLACVIFDPILTIVWTFNVLAFMLFMYKLITFIAGFKDDHDSEDMVEITDDLPKYCILLPLRNEPPEVTDILFNSLSELNYPKDKLDIVILIDSDDVYSDHYISLELPEYFRLEIAEVCHPMTKPKVCNMGLHSTDADYVVIYDAEDVPDPNQLLKVLHKFKHTNAECVQCQLHYLNEKPGIIARFFNLEYLIHWRFMSWGIKRVQGDNAVIPLGGTSQHLRVSTVKEMGGWDAYNVTEDCELGVRLARENKNIVLSESTTREFAVDNIWVWIKQRTRWQMGFFITYLVHIKRPIKLIKDLGLYRFIHFLFLTIGSIVNPLITPPLFMIYFGWYFFGFFSDAAAYSGIFSLGWITLIGNFLLVTISSIVASYRYDNSRYIITGILSYFYHLLAVISAYRAIWKYFKNPFAWDKTNRIN